MKLLPFSYTFHAGRETKIGYDGYMMFIRATSPISSSIAFAVYYDGEPAVWHISPLPFGETGLADCTELCEQITKTRYDEILLLLVEERMKNENKDNRV